MTSDTQDEELKAISTMLSALKGLNTEATERVLAYVLTRLGVKQSIGGQFRESGGSVIFATEEAPPPKMRSSEHLADIRTFTEEKAPKSAVEMAAVVAYFVQYEAAGDERKTSITKADIEKYFHLAKFRKPKDAHFTLNNSKNAGYLDQLERRHYALNPVGYNLVVHKLPHKGGRG